MKWLEHVPPSAIPCGQGVLRVTAESAVLARSLATLADSAFVNGQVSGAVNAALRSAPDLARALSRLPTPELAYSLDTPSQGEPGVWEIPFRAFALPRGS